MSKLINLVLMKNLFLNSKLKIFSGSLLILGMSKLDSAQNLFGFFSSDKDEKKNYEYY